MNDTTSQPEEHKQQIDQGAYDVIRQRLESHASDLRSRIDQLNTLRKEVFGSIDFKLIGTDRITTSHNCIPRDIVAVGERFLMGFNVHFGLKTRIDLADVFAVYRFENGSFHEEELELLDNAAFRKDFVDLYRYYKNATFAKFFRKGPHVYMKFHVGRDVDDFKTFKWLVNDNGLQYLGNRSDEEVRYPNQHEFNWVRATREMQRPGPHPHYSINDLLFVETIGGDLTIKVENNTDSGEGVYTEPVDDPDQTLDDAEIHYVIEGHLVLLRIKPYQEDAYRYYIFNAKLQQVIRCDGLRHACVLLPEDHGLMTPNGYYLSSGRMQVFPNVPDDLVFERRIAAPNGEDFGYLFYNRRQGLYVLMAYNLIEQVVDTPTICNGYAFFGDGQMVLFKSPDNAEPQKHHAVQVWQTPFVGPDHVSHRQHDSFLFKVGNRDIVRGMAECVEVIELINREELYRDLYVDLVRKTSDLVDAHFWLTHDECAKLSEPLLEIKSAAQAAVGEYEKVCRIRLNTKQQVGTITRETEGLISTNASRIYESILAYVEALASLREMRGHIIGLRELRYVNGDEVDGLEQRVQEQTESLSRRTVEFLLNDESLNPYRESAAEHEAKIDGLQKVTEIRAAREDVQKSSDELEMLIDIVSNLRIDDATQRTTIIDNISAIFSLLNATRTKLNNRMQQLGRSEGIAEFNSQLKLLSQSVANYMELCDTAAKTEQYLTKVMVQLEELDGRFAEFDDFVLELTEKRDEIYNAFETRKLQLVEKRNRRAESLGQAADRILRGVKTRVEPMESIDQINSYFASDLMIDRVRDICRQLGEIDDTVRVDDIQSRMKMIREDAVRQLKDRLDLHEGRNAIRFGRHAFSINNQAIDLTTIVRDGKMQLHLTGTQFFEPIVDERLEATREVWDQEVVSENESVYRAEYLAYLMSKETAPADDATLLQHVQKFMAPRYHEGYTKGVHDVDAAKYLGALLDLRDRIGLLRYSGNARALARLWWGVLDGNALRQRLTGQVSGFGAVGNVFPDAVEQRGYIDELRERIRAFADENNLDSTLADEAGEYLFFELADGQGGFVVSPEVAKLHDGFWKHLRSKRSVKKFEQSLSSLSDHPIARYRLVVDWARAFVDGNDECLDELSLVLFEGGDIKDRIHNASVRCTIDELVGSHGNISDGKVELNYNEFMSRMRCFAETVVPKFEAFSDLKRDVIEGARNRMRVDEFRPKVLTSFVRNKLIDSVYLPLIGENLAKQIGTAGESKRTDRMGMLLLISPPGYGKTTLMEYIANRMGLIFMKINGPAIGHAVTSLDPSQADNAAAREELEKLNLAFEMGDNVMIYVDDIQHTNSEFLQKFISLCDAQRRVEGVYQGNTRTYDFRGRKVAVVMAGNPYTESGQKFRIPDMLANRADTYNLGDIIGDHEQSFKMSYLENALISNAALNVLATRSREDVHGLIRIAETDSRDGVELEGSYAADEMEEMLSVMKKLIAVREVVLKVNQQYIRSAGMEDQYRTEPSFLLQGSYRNMNRIAERVQPVMNDDELRTLVLSSYEQDAHTLTTGTEANVLKFKEMMDWIDDDELARWDEIRKTFRRNNEITALGDDRTAAVVNELTKFNRGLGAIGEAIVSSKNNGRELTARFDEKTVDAMRGLIEKFESKKVPTPQEVTGEPSPYEIQVTNKVPETFLWVLKEQFVLMRDWMEPLTKITAGQEQRIGKLTDSLNGLIERYDEIIDRLESTRDEEEAFRN